MTEPTNGAPEGATPDVNSTQHIPSPPTEAMPTAGGYSYPADSAGPGSTPSPTPASPTAPAGVSLSDDPSSTTAKPKRTGLLIGGLATALVLGGGGVFAATQLSGGGTRPADVLPGDSYAYFQLDIDPSAGQKIAAVRFLDKLPQVKDNLGGDDMRKKLWDSIAKDAGNDCLKKFNYDNDIAPWLGDRVGMSMRPGGTKDMPNMAIALQVTDEGKATDTLTKLFACDSGSKTDVRMKDGYAIITPEGHGDDTIAAVGKGSLASNVNFSGDMTALGEQGVAAAWFDGAPAFKEISNLAGGSLSGQQIPTVSITGRYAMALRFDPSYIELAGVGRGIEGIKKSDTNGNELASLPADTLGALQISGADQAIDVGWPQLVKLIQDEAAKTGGDNPIPQLEQQLGIKLPDDLKVLLGKSLTVAVPDQQFGNDLPVVGAKVVTTDVKRAEELLTKIEDAANGQLTLNKKVNGDTLAVATTQDYADNLIAGGKLGDTDGFKAAVGDLSTSNGALYVDLDKAEKQYLDQVTGDMRNVVEALKAIGFNSSTTADGEGTFSLRLLGN